MAYNFITSAFNNIVFIQSASGATVTRQQNSGLYRFTRERTRYQSKSDVLVRFLYIMWIEKRSQTEQTRCLYNNLYMLTKLDIA